MKVIVAGMPKTGTKSMNAALTKLGYKVYDFPENLFLLKDEYNKIVHEGWTTEDFRRMYENVDAVVDFPAFFFWEEIHRAFPDAKIILTMRDDEEQWLRSFRKQMEASDSKLLFILMRYLSPTYRRVQVFANKLGTLALGVQPPTLFRKMKVNGSMGKRLYRAHNAYVQQVAPKEKLLVYKCSEGWGTLCDFLGVPAPNEPFPHKNIGGNVVDDAVEKYSAFRRIQNEVIVSSLLLTATTTVSGYFIWKYGFSSICDGLSSAMGSLLKKFFLQK